MMDELATLKLNLNCTLIIFACPKPLCENIQSNSCSNFFFFIYHSYRRVICTNSRRVDKLIPCVCLKRLIKIACDRSCDSLGYYPNISIPILPCVQLAGVYTYLFPIIETDIKRDIYFQFMAPSWTIELFHRNCEFPFNSILKCTRTGMK